MKNKYKCLYEITGRIEDVATFLVPIGDFAKREWVGLTDDEIMDMYNEPRSDAEMITFARAIEAAHGIKGKA